MRRTVFDEDHESFRQTFRQLLQTEVVPQRVQTAATTAFRAGAPRA